MKIILTKKVKKLGDSFELKRVKSGYARNFLIPQNLAILATKENLKWRESKLEIKQKRDKEVAEKIKETLNKVQKSKIEIPVKVGLKGELFEKINENKVLRILKRQGLDIKKENIILEKPISKIGSYVVGIDLGPGQKEKIKIKVIKEKEKKKLKSKNKKQDKTIKRDNLGKKIKIKKKAKKKTAQKAK